MEVSDEFERLARAFASQPQIRKRKQHEVSRRCFGCGVDFTTSNFDKRFCSQPCQVRHERKQAGRPGPQVKPDRAVSREQYQAYIRSEDWRQKAERAKKRAGFRCQVCNHGPSEGRRLEAHHRTYERLGNEQPLDITVLCDECHDIFSKHGKVKR